MIYTQKRGTIVVPTSDTVTAGTVDEEINGQLGFMTVTVPALEGTGTVTLLGTDSVGGTILNSTAADESTIATVPPQGTPTIVGGTLYLTATTTNASDGTQSAARDMIYNLYYETKHG